MTSRSVDNTKQGDVPVMPCGVDGAVASLQPEWILCPKMVNLSRLDGKSVAVVLNLSGREVVWRGTGIYQTDATLGHVLRIRFDEPNEAEGRPEFLIQESHWRGTIADGTMYGCETALRLNSAKLSTL